MFILIDTTLLVEAERKSFDLSAWVKGRTDVEGITVCDAGIAEWLAGKPVSGEGKRQRFEQYWETFLKWMPSIPLRREVCERAGGLAFLARTNQRIVPLGDALHGAVADLHGMTVLTIDTAHFKNMGIPALNPLEHPSA